MGDNGRAKYPMIADELRRRIADGTWEPDTRIPSETALAQLFDVSLTAVRRAVKEVVADGLLISHHGSGTYVPADLDPTTLAATGFEYVPPPLVIGQVVHYVARGSADGVYPCVCRAAFVTEIGDGRLKGRLGLWVMNPTGFHMRPLEHGGVHPDEGDTVVADESLGVRCGAGTRLYWPGTWHRPERVTR